MVIGSGPAGQRAAIQAAKLRRKVAMVERKTVLGGVSVNTGTIPSKTSREAVLDLSGYRDRAFYGLSHTTRQTIGVQDLMVRTEKVIRHEIDVTRHQLLRNGMELFRHRGFFDNDHMLRLDQVDGGTRLLSFDKAVIACGTFPRAIRTSPSTANGFSKATMFFTSTFCRARWWWSARGRGLRVRQHVRGARRTGDADRQAG